MTRKYIILFGKFGHMEGADKATKNPGTLMVRRPGDIVDLTPEQAAEKGTSVRLATDEEIAAYEARMLSGAPAPVPLVQPDKTLPGAPLGSTDGVRLTEPAPPQAPVPQPVSPAATAQAPAAPPAPTPAAPVVPASTPATPAAPAEPKAPAKAKKTAKKKSAGK